MIPRVISKVLEEEWDRMKAWIKTHRPGKGIVNCIGSGGNINKLVKLFGNQSDTSITRKKLKSTYDMLVSLPVEVRVDRFGMREDRADVIVPAAEIFLRIMKWGGVNRIIAPKFGLADGLAIEQYLAYKTMNASMLNQD